MKQALAAALQDPDLEHGQGPHAAHAHAPPYFNFPTGPADPAPAPAPTRVGDPGPDPATCPSPDPGGASRPLTVTPLSTAAAATGGAGAPSWDDSEEAALAFAHRQGSLGKPGSPAARADPDAVAAP